MLKDNKLIVPRVSSASSFEDIASRLAGFTHSLDCVNWSGAFPYKPDVSFAIAHCSDAILLYFKVSEESVRACGGRDRDRIWEDSCVEFFLEPELNGGYYNFEFNCIGRLYSAFGADRSEREFLPDSCYEMIFREGTLGSEAFEEKPFKGEWELAAKIPVSCLIHHSISKLDSMKMRANFYKCGDLLSKPHFVSYSPIDTPRPDFHRPEFFADIIFE